MLDSKLRQKVDQLWDKFWSGGLANPLMAIDQLNYLIFLKRLEETDDRAVKRAQATDEEYESLFDGPQDERRWSVWRHYSADEMFKHVRDEVFPWMKEEVAPENESFRAFMKDATFMIPKASLLVEAVNVMQELKILDRNVDTQGDIYEYMLGKLSVAGQIGQFRTPRHIIRAMVNLVDPEVGETVIDPACGTAGFLIAAYQHMLAKNTSEEFLEFEDDGTPHNLFGDQLSEKQWEWLRNGGLIGYDFDLTMVRIAAMNMVLHGITNPSVSYADALGKSFPHKPVADVVLANPPFSGSVEKSDISDEFKLKTTKTELLFVDLLLDLLKPGGRAAVIVPDGVLFGNSRAHDQLRRRLVDQNKLEAVISLPNGVFRPYAGVKASILVFQKGGESDDVWMFDVTADGYSLDDKRQPIEDDDLPLLLESWPSRKTTDKSYTVPAGEVRDADYELTISSYKEVDLTGVEHEDPQDLIDQLEELASRMSSELAALSEELS